jgi:hypothetical protein
MAYAETISREQEILDDIEVNRVLAEIEAYQNEPDSAWAETYDRAVMYIDGLYEEYVPTMDARRRVAGAHLGGLIGAYLELTYGNDSMTPKLYGGSYEQGVIATYHHAQHSRDFLRGMLSYAVQCNNSSEEPEFTDEDFQIFPNIALSHDAIMGNGRGHDERQSSKLAARLPERLPEFLNQRSLVPIPRELIVVEDPATIVGVSATTWDDKANTQAIDPSKGFLRFQKAAGVGDFFASYGKEGAVKSIELTPETFTKKAQGQILTHVAKEVGFSLKDASVDGCLQLIDVRPELTAAYGPSINGASGFFAGLKSADPRMEVMHPGRPDTIHLLGYIAQGFNEGRWNAYGSLGVAREYASR